MFSLGTFKLGKLRHDGQVSIISPNEQIPRQRQIFLFDKALLICKATGEKLLYKDKLDLSNYHVEEGSSVIGHRFNLAETSDNNNNNSSSSSTYTLYAETNEAKQKWIELITLALDNISPPDSQTATHEFGLHTFREPTQCGVCKKLLLGTFFQGYRCNKTDTNVHKECISKVREKWER